MNESKNISKNSFVVAILGYVMAIVIAMNLVEYFAKWKISYSSSICKRFLTKLTTDWSNYVPYTQLVYLMILPSN